MADFWNGIHGFKREEWECPDQCGFSTVDIELLAVLMNVKQHFGRVLGYEATVIINSGCRCVAHNEVIQKRYNANYVPFSSNSQHLYGIASDFVVKDVHADDVADYLEAKYPDRYGIGRYNGRTHFDAKPGRARRWDSRSH